MEIAETLETIRKLYDKGVIKLETVTLKNGITAPVRADLRQAIPYPQLLQTISQILWDKVNYLSNEIDILAGIPETTLPIANQLSAQTQKNAVIVRKGNKSYGKRWVEGNYRLGESCLLIEESVATGANTLGLIDHIQRTGLRVPYVLAFLEYDHGARSALNKMDCELFSLFTEAELLKQIQACGVGTQETIE